MSKKFFNFLLCLCLASYVLGVEEKKDTQGNLSITFYGFTKVAKKGVEHLINYGAGKQALKQLEQKDAAIERQGATIETLALAGQNIQNGDELTHNNSDKTNKDGFFDKADKVLSVTSNGAYVIRSGYDFYNFVYTRIWPNPEDQWRKDNAIEKLAILGAKKQLNKCLAYNTDIHKENDGMPFTCKDASLLFAEAAGQEALNNVKRTLAETQLNKCLAYNMYVDREGDGIPSKCKDISILFAAVASPEALEKSMYQYSLLKKRI